MERDEIIARWIKEEELNPDWDGYIGKQNIPENIMKKYRELYPNDWDDNPGLGTHLFYIFLIALTALSISVFFNIIMEILERWTA